jgi:hypothetical protein
MANTKGILIAICRAFSKAKMPVVPVALPVQSDVGIQFKFALLRPTPQQLQLAMRSGRLIEAALRCSGVQVRFDNGCIVIEIPLPGATIYASALQADGLALPIGKDMQGATVYMDFIANPHLLVLGPTQCGKTTMIKGMLYHLKDAQVCIAALKAKIDWSDVQGALLLDNIDDIQAFSKWLMSEIDRRMQSGEKSLLFYVVDDAFNLMQRGNLYLDEIASIGRAVGVHLIVVSQRAGDAAGGAVVTGNITSRIVFRTASAADSATMTGRAGSGAERLQRYHALLITTDDERQFKTACLSSDDVVTVSPVTGYYPMNVKKRVGGDKVTQEAEPVTDQVTTIQQLHASGYSKNKIMFHLWGDKNSRYLKTVNEALGEAV